MKFTRFGREPEKGNAIRAQVFQGLVDEARGLLLRLGAKALAFVGGENDELFARRGDPGQTGERKDQQDCDDSAKDKRYDPLPAREVRQSADEIPNQNRQRKETQEINGVCEFD